MLEKASSETEQITISEFDGFHSIFNSVLTKVLCLFPSSTACAVPLPRRGRSFSKCEHLL